MQFSVACKYDWNPDGHSDKHGGFLHTFNASSVDVAIEIAKAFVQQYENQYGSSLSGLVAELKQNEDKRIVWKTKYVLRQYAEPATEAVPEVPAHFTDERVA